MKIEKVSKEILFHADVYKESIINKDDFTQAVEQIISEEFNLLLSFEELNTLLLSLETLREQLESDEGMENKISRVNKLIIKLKTL